MKISFQRCVFALLFAALTASAATDRRAAARYLVDSWQTDQGLPQNSVISMTQSHDGYLWLATFNGLVRFDGVRFTVFNSHNTPALDSSRIVRLWEDNANRLWVGTESGGLIRRDKAIFERVQTPGQPAQLNAICNGSSPGEVWLTLTDGRLLRFRDNQFTELRTMWNNEPVGAMTPVSLNDGNVLIWTQRGALAWNGATFTPTIEAPNNGDVFAPSR
ncbi:MAG TPA: two-component regulator propeller domain-containing protein, partial [Verrucomicrobiae bacterium]|nr:two-component regulator propeller domain-containing protein [Verrucomicrobiae bacterium]